jgi:Protein of unknown function (DUF3047)
MKQKVAFVSALPAVRCLTTFNAAFLRRLLGGLLLLASLMGCTNVLRDRAEPVHEDEVWRAAVTELLHTPVGGEPWRPLVLPGKRFVDFMLVSRSDKPALSVQADQSVSILRRQFANGVTDVGNIDFSWKIDGLPEGANLGEADRGDSPVRILLSFDGDRSKWSARNHRLSEMSRLLTGEELPYATLMYVWSNQHAPDSVVVNPRTDRIRKVVVESGPAHIGRWREYRRDIRADFVRAFGEEPGPLRAVALMTDTDNTRSRLQAWYGPLKLGQR